MSDPSLGQTGAEGGEFGQSKSRHFGDIKARFKVDDQGLKDLNTHFVKLNDNVKTFKGELKGLLSDTKKWADELERVAEGLKATGQGTGSLAAGVSGYSNANAKVSSSIIGGGGAGGTVQASTAAATNLIPPAGGAGGGGTWGRMAAMFSRAAPIASVATAVLGSGVQAMDNRIQSFAPTALENDRIGLMFRQTQAGMSTLDYSSRYRQPLAQFRLGQGGVNSLLQMEAMTGIQSGLHARGIERMREATGFQMSTQQGASMLEQLADPRSNNRMTIMLGTGLYGPGGQQRGVQQIINDVIRANGLNDPNMARSALQIGSITRANLAMQGVPEAVAQQAILQANQMTNGQARNPDAVDSSYAGAVEDVERAQARRDEGFYREQADNYEVLAERTKGLIEMFAKLEDKLGGIIGVGASTSPYRKFAQPVAAIGGAILGGAAGALTGTPFGVMAGAAGGYTIGSSVGAAIGDPDPSGTGGGTTSAPGSAAGTTGALPPNLQKYANQPKWTGLHPRMKERLIRMFRDNPKMSLTSGYRTYAEQRGLFVSRYVPDPNGGTGPFEGKMWRRVRGATTAPPGKSYHEIGLAADLDDGTGNYNWIVANASKYQLDVGTWMSERWHVQPVELPQGRSTYEKNGSIWGTGSQPSGPTGEEGAIAQDESTSGVPSDAEHGVMAGAGSPSTIYIGTQGQSIASSIQAQFEANMATGNAGPLASGGSVSSGPAQGQAVQNAPSTGTFPAGTKLSGEQVARYAAATGLRGEALQKAIAIAYGESKFDPNATGDVSLQNAKWGPSLGLWQVRSVNAERGKGSTRDANRLKDPTFNAASMHAISSGGSNWRPWSVYTAGIYQKHMGAARKAMDAIGGVGDPYVEESARPPVAVGGTAPPPPRQMSGGGSMQVVGGSTVTIAPTIHLNGGGNSQADARAIANEVIRIINSSQAVKALRSS